MWGMFDENMSERQQQRIADTIRKNADRAAGLRSVEALEDDHRIAWENALKRRHTDTE